MPWTNFRLWPEASFWGAFVQPPTFADHCIYRLRLGPTTDFHRLLHLPAVPWINRRLAPAIASSGHALNQLPTPYRVISWMESRTISPVDASAKLYISVDINLLNSD